MADVIFAGSQDRRAQNLAEVTLIFDNSDRMLNYDYNEVRSMKLKLLDVFIDKEMRLNIF